PNRPLTDAYYFLDSGHARFYRTEGGGWEAIPPSPRTPRTPGPDVGTPEFGVPDDGTPMSGARVARPRMPDLRR
ncbi:hypothetical protein, partial [Streptomyces sp. NPDC047985]|uniref:hypothetical protein n=1 Tax=Streptomyces sp. NPDC047985 TaxID=3155384 RepID=UPI0034405575